MSKFEVGQKVIVSYNRTGIRSEGEGNLATDIVTDEKGEILEIITEGRYAGQYRCHIGWLIIVQPESAIRAA